MKKSFLLIVLEMLCLSASAQFQDMVTLQDTDVYMIPTKPAKISGRESYHACGTLPVGIFVQQYVPQDSVVVYGIALTINSWGGSDTIYKNPHYTAVMMQRPPGGHDSAFLSLNYRKLKYVDSVRLDSAFVDGASVKYSKFRYEFDLPNSYYSIVPCYEFYFATPKVMTDTFYVGRKYREENDTINPASEYSGLYQITPVVPHSFWYSGAPSGWPLDTAEFLEQPGANAPYHYWGFSFPIIGFHCNPLDEENHSLLLTDITNNGATVHWYSIEDGATYNVRVSSVDGSVDTIVVTTDSSYTFSGLPTNTRYTVQVRKQCYYATASYDTTVYSPWTSSSTLLLGSDSTPSDTTQTGIVSIGGVDFTFSPNPAHGTVVLTLEQAAEDAELTLCDLGGRELQREHVSGTTYTLDVATLPAGVYFLKLTTPQGIATRRLLVE